MNSTSNTRRDLSYFNDPVWNPPTVPFWIHDPRVLFQTFELISTDNMSSSERLNALTRSIIIISIILFTVRFPLWWLILLLGLIIVVILWMWEQYYLNRPPCRRPPIIQKVTKIIEYIDEQNTGHRDKGYTGVVKISGRGR
jgi:hypothetical protein